MHLIWPVLLTFSTAFAVPSVRSCGGPSDHLSNVSISLSPDPIAKNTPFTLSVSGVLDEDHVDGNLDVDLDVKALRIIDDHLQKTISYTISPGVAKGPQTIVIGPVTLPSDPGDVKMNGQIRVTNGKGEPVACVAIDIDVPLLEARKFEEDPPVNSAKSCTKPGDHLQNLKVSSSATGTTITASLDEDLPKISADVDITVKALFLKVPLKLAVPVSFQPQIPKGDWKLTFSEKLLRAAPVTVEGQVAVTDGNGQQVACIALDAEEAILV